MNWQTFLARHRQPSIFVITKRAAGMVWRVLFISNMAVFDLIGKDFEFKDSWQCYDCKKWFSDRVSHGHFQHALDREKNKQRQASFLEQKKQEELKRFWKRGK